MDLRALKDSPPRDWPADIRKNLLDILRDDHASETDLLLAAELAGDSSITNDALKDALRSILQNSSKSERVRSRAAISLRPVVESATRTENRQGSQPSPSDSGWATASSSNSDAPPFARLTWGPLEIRRTIGHGRFGTVHVAWDPESRARSCAEDSAKCGPVCGRDSGSAVAGPSAASERRHRIRSGSA